MTANRFIECARKLRNTDIEDVERKLGFTLPPALRLHYLAFNGGEPRRRWFRSSTGFEDCVDRFLPMKYPSFDDEQLLEDNYLQLCVTERRVPANLLPFAEDEGGGPYCLDRLSEAVVFFNLDRENDHERAIRVVAPSLEAFVSGMLSERDFLRGKRAP